MVNIFILAEDTEESAEYYCDEHVNKIITEIVQLLFSVLWFSTINDKDFTQIWVQDAETWMLSQSKELQPPKTSPYIMRFKGHPWFNFALKSKVHYLWVIKMGKSLATEFKERRQIYHRAATWLPWLENISNHPNFPLLTSIEKESILLFPIVVPIKVIPAEILGKYNLKIEEDRKKVQVPLSEAVQCYREVYNIEKSAFATWKWKHKTPHWFEKKYTTIKLEGDGNGVEINKKKNYKKRDKYLHKIVHN